MRFGLTMMTAAMALLLGCSDVSVPKAKSTTGRMPTVAELPDEDETVRGREDPPVVTLELGNQLRERRLTRTEELPPNIIIPNTNLNGVPVTAALQGVLAGTDVSLSWEAGTFESRLVTVMNLSGPLPKVVEKICTSAKVFCSYRGGLLELKEKETFIIDLPTVPTKNSATGAATNTMAETIGELAGEKVRLDTQGGNLLYTTTVDGHENVRQYLDQLRHGRPLLVMQLYIWEVTLDNDNATGINWSNLKLDKMGKDTNQSLLFNNGRTAFMNLASPGVSLGAKLAGKLDADIVLQFLSTQGQVQTISNPQLTFVSGSNAEFRVGGKKRYISQVGTSSSVSGSSSSTTASNTVSTDSLDTGLKVTMGGGLEGEIISAVLDLEIQDVISLNPTSMENGTTVDLPETSERKVSTSLRVRPGDNLVLAGLVTSRDTNDRDGISLPFGVKIPTASRDQLKNSELVILVKPSVVKFAEAPDGDIPFKPAKVKNKKDAAIPAVMIDKDGARVVKLPESPIQPVSLAPAQPQPELTVAVPAPYGRAPSDIATTGADNAVVDKRLMQRGFSHAFDEMQQPVSSFIKTYGGAK